MALTLVSYADLQAALTAWLGDTLTAAQYDITVILFEAHANRTIRCRQMETQVTLVTTAGVATMPDDMVAWRRLTWIGSSLQELEYVEPSYLKAAYPTQPAGRPSVFTIEGTKITIMPVDDSSNLQLDYYQEIPPLVTNSTNWLMSRWPDAYLFGTLAEANMFRLNDDRSAAWIQRRDAVINEIMVPTTRARGIGGMRLLQVTP